MEANWLDYDAWLLPADAPAHRDRRGIVVALAWCPRHRP